MTHRLRLSALGASFALAFALLPGPSEAQTLRGGTASLDRQNEQARLHDFTYLRTAADVSRFVELGYLVPVVPNENLEIHNVSFPYARPEVRVFLDRLSSQYRAACGEKLVVTSLTRPISNQPANASVRSVHPTGMAVDLRRSGSAACRNWLESTLLSLERRRVIEAIYERNPPHYHVAVYPDPYIQYVAELTGNRTIVDQLAEAPVVEVEWVSHTVRRGETLTLIGSRYGAAVARIQAENGIAGSRINVGQVLRIPVYGTAPATNATRVASSEASADAGGTGSGTTAGPSAGEPAGANPAIDTDTEDGSVMGGDGVASESGESAGPAATRTHRVARGESLWALARRYGVSEADIRRENGLSGTSIQIGQTLRIPTEGAGNGASGPLLYEVRSGDSLWAIASRHGTSVEALRRTNGLGSGRIHPGQVLEVPSSR